MIIFKLFIGVHEQSYIAHAIEYAAGWHDQVQNNPSGGNANYFTSYKMSILMILVQIIIYH